MKEEQSWRRWKQLLHPEDAELHARESMMLQLKGRLHLMLDKDILKYYNINCEREGGPGSSGQSIFSSAAPFYTKMNLPMRWCQ